MLLRSGSGENSLPGCRWLHLSYLLVGGRERDRHTDKEGDNNEDGERERETETETETEKKYLTHSRILLRVFSTFSQCILSVDSILCVK